MSAKNYNRVRAGKIAKQSEIPSETEVAKDYDLGEVNLINKNHTKADAGSYSIKCSKSSSTQVHLPTLPSLIQAIPEIQSVEHILQKFLGSKGSTRQSGRLNNKQLPSKEVALVCEVLDSVTYEITDLCIGDVEGVIWRDTKKNKDYIQTKQELLNRVSSARWVALPGAYHLRLPNSNKSLLTIQRKGSGTNYPQFRLYRNLLNDPI